MTAQIARTAIPAATFVDIEDGYGWRRTRHGTMALWTKGYVDGQSAESLARAFANADADKLASALLSLHGHFALVAETPEWTLAAVDRVRSIPLFVTEGSSGPIIGANALRLQGRLRPSPEYLDREAALVLGMSGYTLGAKTLDRRIDQIEPGHFLLIRGPALPLQKRYHAWTPWQSSAGTPAKTTSQLADVTLGVLARMAASVGGRPIVVPLSAGLDSRLIVSGLHRLGVRQVRCFSYGLPGNYEAEAGRGIADRLGYPWTFIRLDPRIQRDVFASADNQAYVRFADTLAAVPFQQDFHAVRSLRDSGWLPKDAVLVNGQTGDFIAGNHIPVALRRARSELDADSRWRLILDGLVAKHYSLWGSLKTRENLALVQGRLKTDIAASGGVLGEPETDHGLFEVSEFRNRQCKYVIGGQRIYEFLGFDWRLPLWDNDYLDFWAEAPLAAKAGQSLYRRMLEEQNWGGVWQGWAFPRRVSPAWLAPLRLAAKAAFVPFGRKRWHRFERSHFAYWMDVVANYAIAPYPRVRRDRRDHRNAISWHVEAYLAAKGLGLDGRAIEAECA